MTGQSSYDSNVIAAIGQTIRSESSDERQWRKERETTRRIEALLIEVAPAVEGITAAVASAWDRINNVGIPASRGAFLVAFAAELQERADALNTDPWADEPPTERPPSCDCGADHRAPRVRPHDPHCSVHNGGIPLVTYASAPTRCTVEVLIDGEWVEEGASPFDDHSRAIAHCVHLTYTLGQQSRVTFHA
jgi:hypothetical protein